MRSYSVGRRRGRGAGTIAGALAVSAAVLAGGCNLGSPSGITGFSGRRAPARLASAEHSRLAGRVQACLQPRHPQSRPRGGWILAHGGYDLWNPSGESHAPSSESKLVAARLVKDEGAGFRLQAIDESAWVHCADAYDIVLGTSKGAVSYLEVVQLRQAVNSYSFPLLGSKSSVPASPGVQVLATATADRSSVTEVGADLDGLVAFIQVRSATGPDPTGWPTTTLGPPTTGAPQPSPLGVLAVRRVLLDILAVVARQPG